MPKGPNGEKRPADVIGCAIAVGKIATGEIEERIAPPSGRKKSGEAGAKARTPRRLSSMRNPLSQLFSSAVCWTFCKNSATGGLLQ